MGIGLTQQYRQNQRLKRKICSVGADALISPCRECIFHEFVRAHSQDAGYAAGSIRGEGELPKGAREAGLGHQPLRNLKCLQLEEPFGPLLNHGGIEAAEEEVLQLTEAHAVEFHVV